MEKLIYLLHKPSDRKIGEEFIRQATSVFIPRLQAAGASNIAFTVSDLTEHFRQVAPDRVMGKWDEVAGALHFWLDNSDERTKIEPILRELTPRISGYLVTESNVQRPPAPRNGERRPGATQLAILHKAAGVSDEEFYHNWHVGHSPITYQIHPWRVGYVRNSVVRVLTPGAEPYRIIVLEYWSELRDYTDESRYFGDPKIIKELYTGPVFADWDTRIIGPTSEYVFA